MKQTFAVILFFSFFLGIFSDCNFDDQRLIAAGGTFTIFSPVYNKLVNMTAHSEISSQNVDFIEFKVLFSDSKNDKALVPGSMEEHRLDFCFQNVKSIVARQLFVVITCKNPYVSCNLKTKIEFLWAEPDSLFIQVVNWVESHPIISIFSALIFFMIMVLFIKLSLVLTKRIFPSETPRLDVEMTSYTKVSSG
jgi:hypothetical protein